MGGIDENYNLPTIVFTEATFMSNRIATDTIPVLELPKHQLNGREPYTTLATEVKCFCR